MRHSIYLLAFALAIFASCSDELGKEVQTQDELKTRSFLPKRSPNVPRGLGSSNMIEIGNIGKVLLPWANGATTQVPVEVLNDYEERDGWIQPLSVMQTWISDLMSIPMGMMLERYRQRSTAIGFSARQTAI